MAGILNSAAQKIKADTAGHTYNTGDEANPGQPVAATLTETVRRIIPTASGDLDSLFRMEPTAAPVASPNVPVATSATRGPNGGLVPAALSHLFNGAPTPGPGPELLPGGVEQVTPAPEINLADIPGDVKTTALAAKGKGQQWWSTARRRLGV